MSYSIKNFDYDAEQAVRSWENNNISYEMMNEKIKTYLEWLKKEHPRAAKNRREKYGL